MSIDRMLAKLSEIREVMFLYAGHTGRPPTVQYQIEDLDPLQQQIFTALELEKYAA